MDKHNIAIVRATEAIPFDGEVRPVKDVPFIKKETSSVFAQEMNSMLNRKGMLKQIDWDAGDEAIQNVREENKQILAQYMPYTSVYNSMVLWSLNGLVPDDGSNTFSKKTCAMIDGLEEQMDAGAEVVSLKSTDAAIKGAVKLSKNATILINQTRFDALSEEEKQKLEGLGIKVVVFEGELKNAVDTELIESGRYTAENLALVKEGDGYMPSATSEEVAQTVKNIAQEENIPQILHIDIFRDITNGEEKLDSVKGEVEQCDIIASLYKNTFFEYIFSKLDIDENVKIQAQLRPDSDIYMEELCDEISRIGIDKYKTVVDEYNTALESLRESGKLPTPQQIIDSTREGQPIDLLGMVHKEQQPKKTNSFSDMLKMQTYSPEQGYSTKKSETDDLNITKQYDDGQTI